MRSLQRGTALAESALVVGLALLIVFNGLQLALFGFYQLHTDAVAFTAARYVSEGGTQAGYTALNYPPAVTTLSAPAPTGGTAQATATQTLAGLLMLPGAAATVTVQGEDREAVAAAAAGKAPAFSISESNTGLTNFYNGASATGQSARAICLAHSILLNGNGNGGNGAFKIFQDHANAFAALTQGNGFPTSVPATPDPAWDITNKKFNSYEATIYGWDATAAACNGSGV